MIFPLLPLGLRLAGHGALTMPPDTWPRTRPAPAGRGGAGSPWPPADLAEVVRIYGLPDWAEQSYKQVEDGPGWADFQVRSDIAIRRH
jgi:hypothetical protein